MLLINTVCLQQNLSSGTLVNVWNKTWSINKDKRLLPSFQCSALLAWRLNAGWWTWLTWESYWFQVRIPAAWSSRDAPPQRYLLIFLIWRKTLLHLSSRQDKCNFIRICRFLFILIYEQLNSLVHVPFSAESKIIFTSLRKTGDYQ